MGDESDPKGKTKVLSGLRASIVEDKKVYSRFLVVSMASAAIFRLRNKVLES